MPTIKRACATGEGSAATFLAKAGADVRGRWFHENGGNDQISVYTRSDRAVASRNLHG
jgi:hypothetical protein